MTKSNFFLRNVATGIACLAATMMFSGCDPTDPDDDNDGDNVFDGKITGTIVNAGDYNIAQVKAYGYKDGWEIASGTCQNGTFTITLPATIESSRLDSFSIKDGITLNDVNVKQTHFNVWDEGNLYACDNAGKKINRLICRSEDEKAGIETFIYVDRNCTISGTYISHSDRNDDGLPDEFTLTYSYDLKTGWNITYGIVKENGAEFTTTKPNVELKWYLGESNTTPDPLPTVKQISRITELAVFNSDYYSSGAAYKPYTPQTVAFAYDNSGKLKELYSNNVLALTWNYDIAGEVRINEEIENYSNTYRATLSNGKVSKIQWDVDATYNPEGNVADLTYDSAGYLTGHTSIDTYGYDDCNAQHLIWTDGNITEVQQLNCTTKVYNRYATYEYSQELNSKTNLDLNVLFSDILSNSALDSYDEIYRHPACYFALTGLTGKRSKNLLLKPTSQLEENNVEKDISIYTEATAPAVGSVLYTYYNREFDGNFNYIFDTNGYPTKLNRQVKVTKIQRIYDSGTREYLTPHDDWERQQWTESYGEGPWFYIHMQTHNSETVEHDTYTWTIEYKQ